LFLPVCLPQPACLPSYTAYLSCLPAPACLSSFLYSLSFLPTFPAYLPQPACLPFIQPIFPACLPLPAPACLSSFLYSLSFLPTFPACPSLSVFLLIKPIFPADLSCLSISGHDLGPSMPPFPAYTLEQRYLKMTMFLPSWNRNLLVFETFSNMDKICIQNNFSCFLGQQSHILVRVSLANEAN
jgi:hypothetical protein